MKQLKRREFLKTTAGVAAGATVGPMIWVKDAQAQWSNTPEKDAKLRVLRWKRFVQGDEDQYLANVKKFTEKTGIEVRVDAEGWEDVRPKAAVAANTGAGPDIILSTNDDANLYPDKLVDVTDLCTYLGKKYGGFYPVCDPYLRPDGKKWIGVPLGVAGVCMVYRESHIKAAGFNSFPKDTDGFLKLCKATEGQGHAAGIRARQRHRRRRLDPLAALGLRRQAGRQEQQGRDRQPGDDQGAGVRQGTVRHVRAGHAVVARSEQQQGVPRRADLTDQQRHLDLLRGQDLEGSEGRRAGGRHQSLELSDRAGRQAERVPAVLQPDDLQVHQVPEGGQGVPALHDGGGADQSLDDCLDRLRDAGADGVREESDLDHRIRSTRRTAIR